MSEWHHLERHHTRRQAMEQRRSDWRCGALVYQILADRFAPSRRLPEKAAHYAPPRMLRTWDEEPKRGPYLTEHTVSSAEMEFWGGDLESLRERLDYLTELGVEVLQLNPIFEAFTNHKYDVCDFRKVDPQFGTREDLRALIADVHSRGLRLILDGVFNHMGRRSPWFCHEKDNPPTHAKPHYFLHDEQHPKGYRSWRNVGNLPEVNLELEEARRDLIEGPDSVVAEYLSQDGIDGWRLDCAPDLGFRWLATLMDSARAARPDSVVIGECWNYPEEWLEVVDGVLNMHVRELILGLLRGALSPGGFNRALDRMAAECDFEGLLRSHLVVDNHDVPRLRHVLPQWGSRRLARVLQFALPGCPVLYYGSELGMTGGPDPANRNPMRWDLVDQADNEDLRLVRALIDLRRTEPALRWGDLRMLEGERAIAFLRLTDRATETVLALMNPGAAPTKEMIPVRHSPLMDAAPLKCLLTGREVTLHSGTVEVELEPWDVLLLRTVDRGTSAGYSMFKRVP